jgi:hypothetical protein
MARKHNLKRNRVSAYVEKKVIATERKIVLNPTTNEYEVKVIETVQQGRAVGSTIKGRGKPNVVNSSKGGKK